LEFAFLVERRRRFNINDRIKELGTLLPKQNDAYFDIVRDVRGNKGSILKASVDYIRLLKRDKERREVLEEKCAQQEKDNINNLLKIQEYEEQLKEAGLPVDRSALTPATRLQKVQLIRRLPQNKLVSLGKQSSASLNSDMNLLSSPSGSEDEIMEM